MLLVIEIKLLLVLRTIRPNCWRSTSEKHSKSPNSERSNYLCCLSQLRSDLFRFVLTFWSWAFALRDCPLRFPSSDVPNSRSGGGGLMAPDTVPLHSASASLRLRSAPPCPAPSVRPLRSVNSTRPRKGNSAPKPSGRAKLQKIRPNLKRSDSAGPNSKDPYNLPDLARF